MGNAQTAAAEDVQPVVRPWPSEANKSRRHRRRANNNAWAPSPSYGPDAEYAIDLKSGTKAETVTVGSRRSCPFDGENEEDVDFGCPWAWDDSPTVDTKKARLMTEGKHIYIERAFLSVISLSFLRNDLCALLPVQITTQRRRLWRKMKKGCRVSGLWRERETWNKPLRRLPHPPPPVSSFR